MVLLSSEKVAGRRQNRQKMLTGGVTFGGLRGLYHWPKTAETPGGRSLVAALFRRLVRVAFW